MASYNSKYRLRERRLYISSDLAPDGKPVVIVPGKPLRVPNREEFLHLSIDGFAACDGRKLSATLDSSSPQCSGAPVCKTCLDIQTHLQRK